MGTASHVPPYIERIEESNGNFNYKTEPVQRARQYFSGCKAEIIRSVLIRLSRFPDCCRYPGVLRADVARRVEIGAAENGRDDPHRRQMGSQRRANYADLRPKRREFSYKCIYFFRASIFHATSVGHRRLRRLLAPGGRVCSLRVSRVFTCPGISFSSRPCRSNVY